MTSHDVVAVVRRATGAKRAGHGGTLDPFATGLLVVLLGRATRLIPLMQGEPKVYDATIRLGEETDTDDSTGVVVRRADAARRIRHLARRRTAHRRHRATAAGVFGEERGRRARVRGGTARRSARALSGERRRSRVARWRSRRERPARAHHVRRRHLRSRARARPRSRDRKRGAPHGAAPLAERGILGRRRVDARRFRRWRGRGSAAARRGIAPAGPAFDRSRAGSRLARQSRARSNRRSVWSRCSTTRAPSSPSRNVTTTSFDPRRCSPMPGESARVVSAGEETAGFPQLLEGAVVTVGTFDGVHLGHRDILRRLHEHAAESSCPALLVTFRPHPLEVVNPSAAPMLLTPGIEQFDALGRQRTAPRRGAAVHAVARRLLGRVVRARPARAPVSGAPPRDRLRPRARQGAERRRPLPVTDRTRDRVRRRRRGPDARFARRADLVERGSHAR